MAAFGCLQTTATYCVNSCHNCSNITGNNTIIFSTSAHSTSTSLSKEIVAFQRDVKRATIRAENKKNFITWAGTKNGRPFHLRKWYR